MLLTSGYIIKLTSAGAPIYYLNFEDAGDSKGFTQVLVTKINEAMVYNDLWFWESTLESYKHYPDITAEQTTITDGMEQKVNSLEEI